MSLGLNCFVSNLIAHEIVHEQFFFCLGSVYLLHEPKIKAQAWVIYKQINMNKFFYWVEFELFMIGLVHLQPYVYNCHQKILVLDKDYTRGEWVLKV